MMAHPYQPKDKELETWHISRATYMGFPISVRRALHDFNTPAKRYCGLMNLLTEIDDSRYEAQRYRPDPHVDPDAFDDQPVYTDQTYTSDPHAPTDFEFDETPDASRPWNRKRELKTLTPQSLENLGAPREVVELAFLPAPESHIALWAGELRCTNQDHLKAIAMQQSYHAYNRGDQGVRDQCQQCYETEDGHGSARFEVCRNLFIAATTTDDAYTALHGGEWYEEGRCASCVARGIQCSLQRTLAQRSVYRDLCIQYRNSYHGARFYGPQALREFQEAHSRPKWEIGSDMTDWDMNATIPPECELKTGP